MRKVVLPFFACILLLGACSKSNSPASPPPPLSQDKQTQILNNYANILEAGYEDSYNMAVDMQASINAFIANPTAQGLEDAKAAWLAAREPYMQTEAARFYGGPIDGDDGDGLLNSWPLDEGYIDYLSGDPHSYSGYAGGPDYSTGIINMPTRFPNITETILIQNNQPDGGTTNANGDPVDVSVGYHAIEFLLWGQDDSPASDKIPGRRPYTDYVTGAGGTAQNQARRAEYLQVVTQLVVDNLKELVDAWAPGQDNYRKSFVANTATGIANIFNGIGRLAKGEMSGERMGVPLALHSQEQEHSCFSDNTHRDLWLDMQGIVNVYNGKYTRTNASVISGLGLKDFVSAQDTADNNRMLFLLAAAQQSLRTIEDNKPFDYLIDGSNSAGNQIVQNGVTAVGAVADWISQIAHDLKLTDVNIPAEN
jgi:putative iron-regulated protein